LLRRRRRRVTRRAYVRSSVSGTTAVSKTKNAPAIIRLIPSLPPRGFIVSIVNAFGNSISAYGTEKMIKKPKKKKNPPVKCVAIKRRKLNRTNADININNITPYRITRYYTAKRGGRKTNEKIRNARAKIRKVFRSRTGGRL